MPQLLAAADGEQQKNAATPSPNLSWKERRRWKLFGKKYFLSSAKLLVCHGLHDDEERCGKEIVSWSRKGKGSSSMPHAGNFNCCRSYAPIGNSWLSKYAHFIDELLVRVLSGIVVGILSELRQSEAQQRQSSGK